MCALPSRSVILLMAFRGFGTHLLKSTSERVSLVLDGDAHCGRLSYASGRGLGVQRVCNLLQGRLLNMLQLNRIQRAVEADGDTEIYVDIERVLVLSAHVTFGMDVVEHICARWTMLVGCSGQRWITSMSCGIVASGRASLQPMAAQVDSISRCCQVGLRFVEAGDEFRAKAHLACREGKCGPSWSCERRRCQHA